jgi:GT2 family glycosyltransferase
MSLGKTVGIVIVNYNGLLFIKECLDSLNKIDYPEARIVVVDNASSDGSPEWIVQNHPQTQIIRLTDNFGFSRANNEGIRWCLANNCEYVLLLNNDTLVEADFLQRIMEHADSNSLLVPRIYFYDNKKIINNNAGSFDFWRGITIPWFYGREDSKASQQVQIVSMASACALLIPRDVFSKIGFLDEKYFLYWEDTDFIVRSTNQGFVIKFIPQAVIYHKESSSSGGRNSLLALYYNNRNRFYFMSKHKKNAVQWIFFLIYYFFGRLAHIIIYLCRGRVREIRAISLGVWDCYKGKSGSLSPAELMNFK